MSNWRHRLHRARSCRDRRRLVVAMSAASRRWYRGSRKSETGFLVVLQSKHRVISMRRRPKGLEEGKHSPSQNCSSVSTDTSMSSILEKVPICRLPQYHHEPNPKDGTTIAGSSRGAAQVGRTSWSEARRDDATDRQTDAQNGGSLPPGLR